MDFKQLACFAKSAELGSVSRAAQALRIAQPAVSRQIAALEKEVGVPLLLRHGRGVELTEAGRRLVGHARDVLERVDRARQEMDLARGQAGGQVAFGMTPSAAHRLGTMMVKRFRRRFPEAQLRIHESFGNALREWLVSDKIDAAVLYDPPTSWGFEVEPVLEEDFCVVGPPGDPLLESGRVPLSVVAGLPLILPTRDQTLRRRLETAAVAAKVPLSIAVELDSFPVIKELVRDGEGYTILTYQSVELEVAAGVVSVARIDQPRLARRVTLVTPRHRPISQIAREAVREARLSILQLHRGGQWDARPIAPMARGG